MVPYLIWSCLTDQCQTTFACTLHRLTAPSTRFPWFWYLRGLIEFLASSCLIHFSLAQPNATPPPPNGTIQHPIDHRKLVNYSLLPVHSTLSKCNVCTFAIRFCLPIWDPLKKLSVADFLQHSATLANILILLTVPVLFRWQSQYYSTVSDVFTGMRGSVLWE